MEVFSKRSKQTTELRRASLVAAALQLAAERSPADITTGDLITSFNHSLNGLGKTITASPDGSRIYVGGSFTAVDGSPHYRIAAF